MRITAIIIAITAICFGASIGPRPGDVERIMATKEYKADEAAHLTKWETK
jgi:hypothetical protein